MSNMVRKVLLFGKTGDGKSSLANMLVNGNLENPVFKLGDGMDGVTSSCNEARGRNYEVVDTVGLGEETESERKDAADLIYQYLKRTRGEYSHIIFVKKAGRLDELDKQIASTYQEVFKGAESAFMVVITNCAEPQQWYEQNKQKLLETYSFRGSARPTFAFVDFPPPSKNTKKEALYKEEREESLVRLEKTIGDFFLHNNFLYFQPEYTAMDDFHLRRKANAIWLILKPLLAAVTSSHAWKRAFLKLFG